jgi:hypothetical protein
MLAFPTFDFEAVPISLSAPFRSRIMSLTIRTLPIDTLIPAPYNPRKPLTAKALAKLRTSLETFGLVEPLVWNERTGHIVGGHARLRLLKELGVAEVPVSVVQLDDDREKALNVMLNNLEAQGRYDREALLAVLEPLKDLPAFDLTGFDPSILATLNYTPADDLPPIPESTTVDVTITIPKEIWPDVRPRLDPLVAEFELVTHVRE